MESERHLVEELVAASLLAIADPVVHRGLQEALCPIERLSLSWDYGGQNDAFPGWLVACDTSIDAGIAYSDFGFGPQSPFGLISLAKPGFGMDCGWFPTLVQAYLDSFLAAHLPVWSVVKKAGSKVVQILASDLPLSIAFKQRNARVEAGHPPTLHVIYRGDATGS